MATKLFRAPILDPSCPLSEIWNTQGFTSEINAPENIPYTMPNAITNAASLVDDIAVAVTVAGIQSARQLIPARLVTVTSRLNRP